MGANRTRRGSTYVLVIAIGMMVTTTTLATVAAVRIERRVAVGQADLGQARLNALTAIDRALLIVRDNPSNWQRALETAETIGFPLPLGAYDLDVTRSSGLDPLDLLDDPMVVRGVGHSGNARAIIEVRLDANGAVEPGSWRTVVE